MNTPIFLVGPDNTLTELHPTPYETEDLLQRLLGDHPSLLGTGPSNEKLLLIARELAVPDDASGGARWSLDHLFADASGLPVLVEVKRASDTRIRREVVAQMLDYAANGAAYWSIEQIMTAFSKTVSDRQGSPEVELSNFLQGTEPEEFWRRIETNLRAGRVRLVFVADRIPKELRRIVEFLNEHMRPAEVLALELEQFAGPAGIRTLIPRVVGNTSQAQSTKAVRPALPPVALEEWLIDLSTRCGISEAESARKLLEWLQGNNLEVGVTESQDAAYSRLALPNGKNAWPFFIRRSTGKLETAFIYLQRYAPFASEEARRKLLEELRSIPGVQINTVKLNGWPSIPLSSLSRPEVWSRFTAIAASIIERLRHGAVMAD